MRRKQIVFMLLAALLCALLTGALADSSSTLRTCVPDTHTITVDCGKNGGVWVGKEWRTGKFTLEVPRLGSLTLKAEGSSGYRVEEILVKPEEKAAVHGSKLILSGVYEDKTVTISFRAYTPSPYQPTDAERLYDSLLGTGNGVNQLNIVFDEDWWPRDYDLLPIRQGKALYIQAVEDEPGSVLRRLALRASQISRLTGEEELETLHFTNGGLTVTLDLRELTEGPIAWLLKQSCLRGLRKVDLDDMPTDPQALKKVVLTARDLNHTRIEVRTLPSETEQGAWQAKIYLRADNAELDVTDLLTTMQVTFPAPPLTAEEQDARITAGEAFFLPAMQEPDSCACWNVAYEWQRTEAEVYWTSSRRIAPYRMLVQEAVLGDDGWYRPVPEETE